MKEYDVVKLIKPLKDLKIGTIGTIVVKYSEKDFEVEFFDDQNNSIDVYTVSYDYLELFQETDKQK